MIYDCFTFFNELDLLEIRFNILDKEVDYFVLCESHETFSGKPKPLFFEENKGRFKQWSAKIIHIVVSPKEFPDAFQRAAYQKDSIRSMLAHIAEPEDTIYYGDLDEIWKPQTREGKLRQLAYSYYLNNRSSEDWQGTNVVKYKNIRNLNDLRADHSVILEDGGWHFQNMFDTQGLLKKIESYDHTEVDIPWVKDGLQARMDANIDYLGRTHDWKGNELKMWKSEEDLPECILENKDKYKHLWKI